MKHIKPYEEFLDEAVKEVVLSNEEPAAPINEDVATNVAKVRKAMEDAINKIKNQYSLDSTLLKTSAIILRN